MDNKYLNGDKLLPMTEAAARDEYIRNMLAMELVENGDPTYQDDYTIYNIDGTSFVCGNGTELVGKVKLNTPTYRFKQELPWGGWVREDIIVIARKIMRGGTKWTDSTKTERVKKWRKHGYIVYGNSGVDGGNKGNEFLNNYVWRLIGPETGSWTPLKTVSLVDRPIFSEPNSYGGETMIKRVKNNQSKKIVNKVYLQRWVVDGKTWDLYKGAPLYCRLSFVWDTTGYKLRLIP